MTERMRELVEAKKLRQAEMMREFVEAESLRHPEKHLRRPAVEEITGLSRTTIYAMMARGEFPKPVKITGKAVAWPESSIAKWLAERAEIAA